MEGSTLEFSTVPSFTDSSTSSIFPGSFPTSSTGSNGGGGGLGNDGLQAGSDLATPEMSIVPDAPKLGIKLKKA